MNPTNRQTMISRICFGLIIIGALSVMTVRGASAGREAADLLAAKDFWETAGAKFEHSLNATVMAEVKRIADAPATDAVTRLRALKLVADEEGHSRFNERFTAVQAASAVGAAMKHLETDLADPKIKFSPDVRFTHLTVSPKDDDAGAIWVLIESVDPERRGGMNIRVDEKTTHVTQVVFWGNWKKEPRPNEAARAAGDSPLFTRLSEPVSPTIQRWFPVPVARG